MEEDAALTSALSYIRRCPRLGHEVEFRYCMNHGEADRPCFKVLDCWWEVFDVESFLKANLTGKQYGDLLARQVPGNKVTSILELVEKAKQRTGKD